MITERTIYLFERGINGWQGIFGDWKNWPNQAIAWVHNHTEARGQTLLYFIGAMLAGVTRRRRAQQFADLIRQYCRRGWRIVIMAHSEGTATALKALQLAEYPKIAELHLLCGAVTADCHENGINAMLRRDAVDKVVCYVAGKDTAMRIEDTFFGKWFFMIRRRDEPLGLAGPKRCIAGTDKVKTIWHGRWMGFDHSTCFLPHNFDQTMREVIGGHSRKAHEAHDVA